MPTRNEAHNVGPLLKRLTSAAGRWTHEVIFVDDSDDGTEDVLASLSETLYRQVLVLHRAVGERPNGLSGAVVEGFRLARGELVAVIDADLQHPPELLSLMLDEMAEHDADIVIASRYVGDGSADGLADPTRRFVSRATALCTRMVFAERLLRVHDPASGYFVFRRQLLDGVNLRPLGYKILLEVLIRTRWGSVRELPYRFSEREADTSKADLRQGAIFLRHCSRLLLEAPSAGAPWKLGLAMLGSLLAARLLRRRRRSG